MGGSVSCIGAHGIAVLCALPFALVSREVILYYFGGICKRFFYCFESGVAVVPVTGWPATGGAWVGAGR